MLDQLHNTALNSGQKIFDLEHDKVMLIDEMRILELKLKNVSTLQGELNLTREEKRLLMQGLQTFSCRHCKKGLALDVVRAAGVGAHAHRKNIQIKCRSCSKILTSGHYSG